MNETESLHAQLIALEANYWDQPAFAQRHDLTAINLLRKDLGLPLVDPMLRPTHPQTGKVLTRSPVKRPDRCEEMEVIYNAFLKRREELAPHRAYADRVAKATAGTGMTPVEPLATMGCGGGPLLCDVCGKPMILEGGNFHKVYADTAWARQSPTLRINWVSFISGGMVVEIANNGTLRVYHGYIGRDPKDCCNVASARLEVEEAKIDSSVKLRVCKPLTDYIAYRHPEMSTSDRVRLVNDILNETYNYDPGIGINKPD